MSSRHDQPEVWCKQSFKTCPALIKQIKARLALSSVTAIAVVHTLQLTDELQWCQDSRYSLALAEGLIYIHIYTLQTMLIITFLEFLLSTSFTPAKQQTNHRLGFYSLRVANILSLETHLYLRMTENCK